MDDVFLLTIDGRVGWMSGSLLLKVPAHFSVVGLFCLAWSDGCSTNVFTGVGLTTENLEQVIK